MPSSSLHSPNDTKHIKVYHLAIFKSIEFRLLWLTYFFLDPFYPLENLVVPSGIIRVHWSVDLYNIYVRKIRVNLMYLWNKALAFSCLLPEHLQFSSALIWNLSQGAKWQLRSNRALVDNINSRPISVFIVYCIFVCQSQITKASDWLVRCVLCSAKAPVHPWIARY